MNLIELLEEGRIKRIARKSKSKYLAAGSSKSSEARSKKGKFRMFKSLGQGVDRADYGSIFSTPRSNRIYVVTRPTWGKKSHLAGKKKVYKGFSADTPVADIKGYAQRVQQRYLSGGRRVKESVNESTYGVKRIERANKYKVKKEKQMADTVDLASRKGSNPFMQKRWMQALRYSANMGHKHKLKRSLQKV